MNSDVEQPYRELPGACPSPVGGRGILVVDKPEGLTSFAVVAKIKKMLRVKKVGHCGTLDPFATGVLVICVNQATRIADQLSLQDKLYRFTMHLGSETDTLDLTGRVVRSYEGSAIDESDLMRVAKSFIGGYRQQVPRYAAVKVQGKRLYELARKGVEVELPSRDIVIHELKLISYDWPEAIMQVRCSKGTYVRQLAADIGRSLECGAHVRELRRLASGSFKISQAISLQELKIASKESRWTEKLIPMGEALDHLPALTVGEKQMKDLSSGHLDPSWAAEERERLAPGAGPIRLLSETGLELIALWWPYYQDDTEKRRCLRVFN